MMDGNDVTQHMGISDASAVVDARTEVMSTAADYGQAVQAAVHPVVSAVVQSVYNSPSVSPQNAATVAAEILNGLASYTPAILQVTRASGETQAWAGIGIGLLSSILAAFFPHPRG